MKGSTRGSRCAEILFDALAKLPSFAPVLAMDAAGREVRTRAQLNLARTYLAEGAEESAAGVMNEVLRSTIGETLPIEQFGPSLTALHAARETALIEAGTGSLQVKCVIPCRVYVNERASKRRVEGLYLGLYRVWVEAEDPRAGVEPRLQWVRLTQAGETKTVEFRREPIADGVALPEEGFGGRDERSEEGVRRQAKPPEKGFGGRDERSEEGVRRQAKPPEEGRGERGAGAGCVIGRSVERCGAARSPRSR